MRDTLQVCATRRRAELCLLMVEVCVQYERSEFGAPYGRRINPFVGLRISLL